MQPLFYAVGLHFPTADLLLSRASDMGADLLVAGAYHSSQLREAIIGGVSRELLDHMTIPVLAYRDFRQTEAAEVVRLLDEARQWSTTEPSTPATPS